MSIAAGVHGIILFAHGARDARWAEPFERLADMLGARRRGTLYDGPVELAFLELMRPDLAGATAKLATAGCTRITVIPIFFGQGGHLRRDLPRLIEQCQARHPDITMRAASAAGEDQGVIEAISDYCLRQLLTA